MTYAVAAALAATLALAGCNGGKKDPTATPTSSTSSTTSPSPSGSASPSPSPTPSVSVTLPSAARANTEAGAVEFVKFYLTDLDRAREQGDSNVIRALAENGCTFCSDYAKFLDADVKKGHHVKDAQTQIDLIEAESFASKAATVRVLEIDHAYELVDKAGKTVRKVPETPLSLRASISWDSGAWHVKEIEVQ